MSKNVRFVNPRHSGLPSVLWKQDKAFFEFTKSELVTDSEDVVRTCVGMGYLYDKAQVQAFYQARKTSPVSAERQGLEAQEDPDAEESQEKAEEAAGKTEETVDGGADNKPRRVVRRNK